MTCQSKDATNENWIKKYRATCSMGTGNNVKNWEKVAVVQE